jgi:hypothetical protein
MMRRSLIIASALLVAGSTARAQVSDRRLDRLEASTAAVVQAIVDSVRPLGIPAEPIIDKALHAAVRNMSAPVILSSVRARVAELGAARAALAPATESEIIAGADAIKSGASPQTLSALRRARPAMELTIPIGVLADLIGRGVAADTAASVLLQLASMDIRDNELTEFRRMVDRDIALGALPTAAVAIRAEAAGIRDLNNADALPGPVTNRGPTAPRPIPPQRP